VFDRQLQAELSDVEWAVALAPSAGGAPLAWVIDELAFGWQSAQRDAVDAYEGWSRSREGEAYAAYRAAQDRADAAQDAFAEWSRGRP
jgi:hypothetical protein